MIKDRVGTAVRNRMHTPSHHFSRLVFAGLSALMLVICGTAPAEDVCDLVEQSSESDIFDLELEEDEGKGGWHPLLVTAVARRQPHAFGRACFDQPLVQPRQQRPSCVGCRAPPCGGNSAGFVIVA